MSLAAVTQIKIAMSMYARQSEVCDEDEISQMLLEHYPEIEHDIVHIM